MAGKPGMMRRSHQDDVRAKIGVSQIINRLQKHVDGEIELTTSQVQAAKLLLDKSLANAPAEDTLHVDGTFRVEGSWLAPSIARRNAE